MGAYTVGYRIRFTNIEGYEVDCNIWDTDSWSDAEDPIYLLTDLQPSSNPCQIQTIDNNEDKFSAIKPKQVTMKFLSTKEHNLSTFVDDTHDDNKWLVEIRCNSYLLFLGRLILDDLHQEFRDDNTAREVRLTATCGLAQLKDIPLSKFDGTNPKGRFKIIEFIAWALEKTTVIDRFGVKPDIYVVNNLRHEDAVTQPGYNSTYLESKTFEGSEIGTCLSCYDALKIILGECYIHQWKGQWWIRRVDEIETHITYQDRYEWNGVYVNTTSNNYHKEIGLDKSMTLIAPATTVTAVRPKKFVKLDFRYQYPKEIIDNIGFERGNLIAPINILNGAAYTLADWTAFSGSFNTQSAITNTPYIVRTFEDGIEKERFLRLPSTTSTQQWVMSNAIPVHKFDKFTFSIDFRRSFVTNVLGTPVTALIILVGTDGRKYHLVNNNRYALLTTDIFTTWKPYTNEQSGIIVTDNNQSNQSWRTISTEGDVEPIPTDGEIYVLLPYTANRTIEWNNLRFEYKPYIRGGYAKVTGHYNKISSAGAFKAAIEDTVQLSDAPKKLFKGALFTSTGALCRRWFNAAVPFIRAMNPVRWDYLHPYGRIQAFSVWNQNNRTFRLLNAHIRGITSQNDVADLMHTYFFRDKSPHTNNKRFMLLHYSVDLYRCTLQGMFAEVYDDEQWKEYDDTHDFKYLEG